MQLTPDVPRVPRSTFYGYVPLKQFRLSSARDKNNFFKFFKEVII